MELADVALIRKTQTGRYSPLLRMMKRAALPGATAGIKTMLFCFVMRDSADYAHEHWQQPTRVQEQEVIAVLFWHDY